MSLGPLGQIVLAIVMMVAAVALAFLMVMRLINPTLFLCLAAFGLSVSGLILGFIGVAQYARPKRRPPDQD